MNKPVLLAQLSGASAGSAASPPKTIKLEKPQGGAAVTIHLDGNSKLDFSDVASEKLTFVRVGDKLIVLFDNQSTVTIDPVFGQDGHPRADLAFAMGADRTLTGDQFADLFPITTDQSVLPRRGSRRRPGGGRAFRRSHRRSALDRHAARSARCRDIRIDHERTQPADTQFHSGRRRHRRRVDQRGWSERRQSRRHRRRAGAAGHHRLAQRQFRHRCAEPQLLVRARYQPADAHRAELRRPAGASVRHHGRRPADHDRLCRRRSPGRRQPGVHRLARRQFDRRRHLHFHAAATARSSDPGHRRHPESRSSTSSPPTAAATPPRPRSRSTSTTIPR